MHHLYRNMHFTIAILPSRMFFIMKVGAKRCDLINSGAWRNRSIIGIEPNDERCSRCSWSGNWGWCGTRNSWRRCCLRCQPQNCRRNEGMRGATTTPDATQNINKIKDSFFIAAHASNITMSNTAYRHGFGLLPRLSAVAQWYHSTPE